MIDAKLKESLLNAIQNLLDVFDKNMADINLAAKIPITHYVLLKRMYGLDLESLTDIQLAMLCGMFEMTFVAGDYGYNREQNMAINALGDLIFDLSH